MNDIGKFIKERRTQLGLTQLEIANAVGVAEATVSRWESGNIPNMRRSRIASLAKVLKVQPSSLIEWDDDTAVGIHPAPNAASTPNALTLGSLVAEYRRQNNLTVEQFALLSGLSKEHITELEAQTGQQTAPPIETYAAVEKATGMPLDKLMFLTASSYKAVPRKKTFDLTEPEEKLITLYRRMPDEKQHALLLVASSMAEEPENKKEVI